MPKSNTNASCVDVVEIKSNHRLWPRIQKIRDSYCSQYGSQPKFYVRVPGRVNIIGEHVDYCGYPVLPMAIDQSIVLAVGCTEDDANDDAMLYLKNTDSNKFPDFKCDLKSFCIDIPKSGAPEWYKYFLCGVKGIYESLKNSKDQYQPIGMKIILDGNIPPASGLSSSSALVSAATLCTAHVHRMPLDRKQLAAISANCERYIGTQGGGMDQAIAYLAKAGCAQFIEFHPALQASPIQLPSGACFVVANSLAEKNKAATSDFNERVVECRLATRLIAKCKDVKNWQQSIRFSELQDQLHCDLTEMEDFILKYIPKRRYTREDLCEILNVTDDEFAKRFLTANTQHMQAFKLQQRALHVIQESIRVARFREICEHLPQQDGALLRQQNGSTTNGDCNINSHSSYGSDTLHIESPDSKKQLHTLADLMRQSHFSLKDLYECSHEDLDRLVAISNDLDVGARVTGAGWGGCIVALCDSIEKCDKYIQELKCQYFSKLPPHIVAQHQENDFANVVFSTRPCNGAEIFLPNS